MKTAALAAAVMLAVLAAAAIGFAVGRATAQHHNHPVQIQLQPLFGNN